MISSIFLTYIQILCEMTPLLLTSMVTFSLSPKHGWEGNLPFPISGLKGKCHEMLEFTFFSMNHLPLGP
jgi:hypothetical protein